jgi:hypothetical protein
MLLDGYLAMSALRSLNSLLAVLLCAAFASCERKAWREEPHPPLPEKVKPENIPAGGGAA